MSPLSSLIASYMIFVNAIVHFVSALQHGDHLLEGWQGLSLIKSWPTFYDDKWSTIMPMSESWNVDSAEVGF